MTAGFSVKRLNGLVGDRIERLVIFNRSPKEDPDNATRNSVEKNFRLLQECLELTTQRLNLDAKLPVAKIRIRPVATEAKPNTVSILDYFEAVNAKASGAPSPNSARIISQISTEFNDTGASSDLAGRQIPLLVVLQETDNAEGWMRSSGAATALLKLDSRDAMRAVHDIIIDIAIGSSSRFFQGLSPEEKASVVSEKGGFVRSIGGSPFAVSADVAYAAIASCARDTHSASIDLSSTEAIKAAKLWQTFADGFIARHSKTLPHLNNLRPKTPEQIIDTAIELFPAKNRKQIPRAKLVREVQSIKPGTYFLCRITKRTKIAKRAAGLCAAFGIRRLRVGACRILDYERLSAIQHMITDEIVQVAPLEVPE